MKQKHHDTTHTNIKLAVVFCLLAALSFSIMSLFVKLVAPHTTTSMTILFRFGVSFLYILIIIAVKSFSNNPVTFKVHNVWLHLLRAFCAFSSLFLFFYAIKFIPLMDGTLLAMTYALLVPIVAFIFLGIKTKVSNILAIIIGSLGIVLVIKPEYGLFDPHALYALTGSLFAAGSTVTLRELAKKDHHHTIMFYYFLFAVIMGGLATIGHWHTPDSHTIMLLLCMGIFGTLYQDFFIRACAFAPAAINATLLYTSVAFGGAFDFIFWHITPDLYTSIGLLIVVYSSYLIAKSNNKVKTCPL